MSTRIGPALGCSTRKAGTGQPVPAPSRPRESWAAMRALASDPDGRVVCAGGACISPVRIGYTRTLAPGSRPRSGSAAGLASVATAMAVLRLYRVAAMSLLRRAPVEGAGRSCWPARPERERCATRSRRSGPACSHCRRPRRGQCRRVGRPSGRRSTRSSAMPAGCSSGRRDGLSAALERCGSAVRAVAAER